MNYVEKSEKIRQSLKKSQKVNSYDSGEHEEAGTMAHGLLDMEESFQKIQPIILRLTEENLSEEDINNLLFEIGEELNHIYYHIKDSKLFTNNIRF